MNKIAVIGGTGMNQWPGLVVESQRLMETPYGRASAPLLAGLVNGCPALFLARHGEGHKIPPHRINYRANLWALKQAGVQQVVAIAAVGAIAEWFAPGEIALPVDVIDYTYGREHTYSDGSAESELHHVELTHPYTSRLRDALSDAALAAAVTVSGAGVMGVTQGPRLETPAEIARLHRDGCDMVGMTGMPEAALAAELGLDYACLAVSVNWAAGIGSGGIHDEIKLSIDRGMAKVHATLSRFLTAGG
ncbi:MAG: S-methyl-5'-thioinosine phosphorylase [Panacagrimonas sp.]